MRSTKLSMANTLDISCRLEFLKDIVHKVASWEANIIRHNYLLMNFF